jgi:hypothetical protein
MEVFFWVATEDHKNHLSCEKKTHIIFKPRCTRIGGKAFEGTNKNLRIMFAAIKK